MSNNDIAGREVKARIIRLRLVDGTQVNGQININREQGYNRLSDLIANDQGPFLILYNVMVHHSNSDHPISHKTLFINKEHILWAEPDEDQK